MSPLKRITDFLRTPAVKRSLIGLAALLVLLTIFVYAVLPGIVKSRLEKIAPEQLHRQLTIGAVEINPFALAMTLRDLQLMEPEGDVVFASFETLTVNLSTQSVLQLAAVVQQVQLTKPYVHLVRKDAHRYNIDDLLALVANQPPSDEPSRFSVYNIQVEDGRIEFEDRPVKAKQVVSELRLGVPFVSSLPSQVQVFVEPHFSAKVNGTPLLIEGKLRPFADPVDAVVDFKLSDLDLTRYVEYLPFKPQIKVPGARLDLQMTASFRQPKDKSPALTLDGTAALKALRVTTQDGKPVLKLPELALELHHADVFAQNLEVARLQVNGLEVDVAREADGVLGLSRLLPAPSSAAPAAKPSASRGLALGALDIHGATLRYTDVHSSRALQAGVEKLNLSAKKLVVDTAKRTVSVGTVSSDNASLMLRQMAPSKEAPATQPVQAVAGGAPYAVSVERVDLRNWSARLEDAGQSGTAATVVAPLAISMTGVSTTSSAPAKLELKAAVNKTGELALDGSLGLSPFQTDLAVKAKGVDILPLQAYIADRVNLRLTRANLTGNGRLQLNKAEGGALKGGYKGDVTLGNLATVDKLSGSDFLRWKSLYAGGMDLRLEPFGLSVDQLALSEFFARVIIDPQGRINLQDILRDDDDAHRSLTDEDGRRPAASPAVATGAGTKAGKRPAIPSVTIGKLTLQGGRVRFTDNFIQPNYSATLADFGGVVTALSSDAQSRANVDLRGVVNNAPLSVGGRINPLAGNLFLDIKANVRGMELAPLSAYSGRYVGYGIEKGKLSFEVAYRVENRTLTAENRLVLDQLTFGEKVESPTAIKLPVAFAVALLRDRNGVIDVNLPIAGSLDDPQFSVGGLVIRIIGNIILKAVTQPFALLGSLFGGGAELSSLALDPGRAAVPPAGEAKLKSLAKALEERPGLTLDIAGRFDPEVDRAGLQRVSVERKVRALKMKDLLARGESPAPGSVVVSPAEYPDLLKRAYRDEKFPKPRNLVGLPKDLPVEEMEKLMMTNAEIDEDDLIALGNRRAQSVKNWLQKNGQVPAERIFILAPKLAERDGKADGAVGSRVDFSLR